MPRPARHENPRGWGGERSAPRSRSGLRRWPFSSPAWTTPADDALLGSKEDLSSYHISHHLIIYTVYTSIRISPSAMRYEPRTYKAGPRCPCFSCDYSRVRDKRGIARVSSTLRVMGRSARLAAGAVRSAFFMRLSCSAGGSAKRWRDTIFVSRLENSLALISWRFLGIFNPTIPQL